MDILSPGFLVLLGLVPILIAVYIWMLRRRRRFTVRYSSLALVREALPHQSRWRRHLPFALFLLALSSLIIALSRPVSIISVPTGQVTVIFAIDVSRSMCSTDVQPSRIEAAEQAALSFIQRQQATTQIGIVAFSTYAELIQPPTTDTEALQAAIESLAVGRRTAIGSGLLKALDAIAEIDPVVAPSSDTNSRGPAPTPVPRGAFAPDIIVLLTDGVSNTGPLPLDAAQEAVDRGVRVYTVGFGTASGSEFPRCSPQFLGNESGGNFNFGGGGRFGGGQPGNGQQGGRQFGGGGQFGGFYRGIDEATLKQIADMTGGTYHSAESAGELNDVFQNLPMYLITKHETSEISVIFTAIGALLAALAIGLSLLWQPWS